MKNNSYLLIQLNDIEGVKKFIADGGDLNIQDEYGNTAYATINIIIEDLKLLLLGICAGGSAGGCFVRSGGDGGGSAPRAATRPVGGAGAGGLGANGNREWEHPGGAEDSSDRAQRGGLCDG